MGERESSSVGKVTQWRPGGHGRERESSSVGKVTQWRPVVM